MSNKNIIFVLCGNCRTFINCFESCYNNIISKLCVNNNYKIYVYLYLKLTDPGPKGQENWNFTYENIIYEDLEKAINNIKNKYTEINIEYKIIETNEISDDELKSQVLSRNKCISYLANDTFLLRSLHCHYNFEKCGDYILKKEEELQNTFEYIIYIRPDLYFTEPCKNIDTYRNDIITLGSGSNPNNNDHLAIIPRRQFDSFFFDRMKLYRTNLEKDYPCPEAIYLSTIEYIEEPIGKYYIKRN